jgi:hypothetical protein
MMDMYEENYIKRIRISKDYKEMFFSEPTLDKILEAFDIKS